MAIYVGDTVRTVNKITQKDYDILKRNNIKPGTLGEVVGIIVVVNFNGITLEIDESAVEYDTQKSSTNKNDDSVVDNLMNMFGMKK